MMKTNYPLELNDTDRRRIRAAVGRAGMATRKEIRIFADRAIRKALAEAPDPKPVRRPKSALPTPGAGEQVPGTTRCELCERPKDDHGRMSLTCPPRTGRPKGQRFKPVAGGAR